MAEEPRRPRIGLIWTQFAPYHVDRCRLVAERLAGVADVLAVEVATTSTTYAWEPSGEVAGARKITLFPGRSYHAVGWWARFRRQFAALKGCDAVFVGISYAERDVILLAYALRLVGVRVVMMTESKFDDMPRRIERELLKLVVFAPYAAAVVGGQRQADYVRLLGYRRRPVLLGYDTVDIARVRAQGGGVAAPDGAEWADRPFVFVGRFVAKKRVPFLVDAYARYVALAGGNPRRLVLVGSGETEPLVRERIAAQGLHDLVEITGFLQADGVTARLAAGLCLILPSEEEQWGLVVNEALAFNLPVIVGENVGSRDALVRNLVNGFLFERDSPEGLARAMHALADDEATWLRMVAASRDRAPLGHADRLGEAVATLVERWFPGRHA